MDYEIENIRIYLEREINNIQSILKMKIDDLESNFYSLMDKQFESLDQYEKELK